MKPVVGSVLIPFFQLGGREGKVKRIGDISPAPSAELRADVKRLAWQKLQVFP